MRLPRVRLTVRRIMVIVVIVAVLLYVARLGILSAAYRDRANYYRGTARLPDPGPSPQNVAVREQRARIHAYLETMEVKYRRASRYPWLPIAPDPPPAK